MLRWPATSQTYLKSPIYPRIPGLVTRLLPCSGSQTQGPWASVFSSLSELWPSPARLLPSLESQPWGLQPTCEDTLCESLWTMFSQSSALSLWEKVKRRKVEKKERVLPTWDLYIQSTTRLPLSDFCLPACSCPTFLLFACLQNVAELSQAKSLPGFAWLFSSVSMKSGDLFLPLPIWPVPY